MKKFLLVLSISILTLLISSSFVFADAPNSSSTKLHPAFNKVNGVEKWGYINDSGKFVVRPIYTNCEDFQDNGLAVVHTKTRVGLINSSGKLVVAPKYTSIQPFYKGRAIATDSIKKVMIDESGNVVAIINKSASVQPFFEDMAVFSITKNNTVYYGYMDINGKIVIEPKYKYAYNFNNGKAIVTTFDGSSQIVDKNGKVTLTISYKNPNWLSENSFSAGEFEKRSYYGLDGKLLFSGTFLGSINGFQDGLAIVFTGKSYYDGSYGVINKKGNYVIKPEYSYISCVGEGLYAVCKDDLGGGADIYYKKALFDKSGNQLTDYKYYEIGTFIDGYAYAADENSVFFIDKNGNEVKSLPKINGGGKLSIQGNLIKADIDGQLSYVNKNGKIVWQEDTTYTFKSSVQVKRLKYRPDRLTLTYYPQLDKMSDKKVQDKINAKLKELFAVNKTTQNTYKEDSDLYEGASDDDIDYTVSTFGDLLVINKTGYNYPLYAVHGMPTNEYYYVNLTNGSFYELSDLFKKDSNYDGRILRTIRAKIQRDSENEDSMYFPSSLFASDNFILKQNALTIYYYPYDIAAYAAGFPKFDISYGDIIDLIDTKGEMWNQIKNSVIVKTVNSTDQTNVIKDLLESYETNIISAINNNNFSLVSPYLYKDSNLYNAQIKLVNNLNKQKIREQLVDYSVKDIQPAINDQYRIYVAENATIYYPEKSPVTNEYNWIYTAKYNHDSRAYELSDIAKWVK